MPASNTKRAAFTLVELMTVITIITILIAVLLPSLSRARIAAKNSASSQGLHALEVGLEMFRNDSINNGQYPPSRGPDLTIQDPNDLTSHSQYTGANWLADALVGPDLLGWDPRALNPSERALAWNTDSANGIVQRTEPYVDVDATRTALDVGTGIQQWWLRYQGGRRNAPSRVIVDAAYYSESDSRPGFNNGVLYYRANPAAQSTWGLYGTSPIALGKLVYNSGDNAAYWDDAGKNRQFAAAASPLYRTAPNAPPQPPNVGTAWPADAIGTFYEFIENKEVLDSGAQFRRPRRGNSYLLIAPGFDGLYGTTDDITNFKR